jgi:hypothetical protein
MTNGRFAVGYGVFVIKCITFANLKSFLRNTYVIILVIVYGPLFCNN